MHTFYVLFLLPDLQEVLADDQVRLTQAKDVRWLSYNAAVRALRRTYSSVIRSLESEANERRDAQALGLLTFCRKFKFVATLLLFCDALPPLARLSKSFQKANLAFGDVKLLVDGTKAAIAALQAHRGSQLSKLEDAIMDYADLGVEQPTERQLQSFADSIEKPFLANIITNLEERFPNTDIISNFAVFSGTSLDEEGYSAGYGVDNIEELAAHFCPIIVNQEDTLSEWNLWKMVVKGTLKDKSCQEVLQLLISSSNAILYPNLAALASVALVLPMSTVDCERGFSALGRIKTKLRNRLLEATLNQLLFVAVEGPPLAEFNFDEAVTLWAGKKRRRLNVAL